VSREQDIRLAVRTSRHHIESSSAQLPSQTNVFNRSLKNHHLCNVLDGNSSRKQFTGSERLMGKADRGSSFMVWGSSTSDFPSVLKHNSIKAYYLSQQLKEPRYDAVTDDEVDRVRINSCLISFCNLLTTVQWIIAACQPEFSSDGQLKSVMGCKCWPLDPLHGYKLTTL